MSRASLKLCDLCERPLEGYHPRLGIRSLEPKQGLVVTIGYSDGGWGSRRNHINFSGEVCLDCYNAVMGDVEQMSQTITKLRQGPPEASRVPITDLPPDQKDR